MKKVILSLFMGFITIISFCSASTYTIQGNTKNGGLDPIMVVPQSFYSKSFSVHCVFSSENLTCQGGNAIQFGFKFAQIYNSSLLYSTLVDTNNSYSIVCDNPSDIVIDYDFSTYNPGGGPYSNYYGVYFIQFSSLWYSQDLDIPYSCTFVGDNILSAGSCPEVNTGEILSGYILESDINNLYCEEHGYCPIIDTGEELSGMSTLYINDIEHQSAPLINITIPEEYNWDSSVDTGEFKLVISGTNVDHEYIDNIIRTQNSKPSSEDLTNIVSGLIPLFIPGLCIIILLYFIYLFIKKIF